MAIRRPVSRPLPIDLALIGPTVVESAHLREGRVLPAVIDTMVLAEDALWRVSHPAPTVGGAGEGIVHHPAPSSISHLMAIHAITMVGKPDLLEEVAEHIAEIAGDEARGSAALALIEAEYLPFMRLVDPSGIVVPDAEERLADVLAHDSDDEPSARLSRILDPAVLFTKDRHDLLRHRFGVWVAEEHPHKDDKRGEDWFRASVAIREHSFTAQMEVGGRVVIVTSNIVLDGAREAASLTRQNPVPAALLLGGLLLLWWTTRDSPFWSELKAGVIKATTATLDEIAAGVEDRPQKAVRAGATLGRWITAHAGPGLLVTDVARTLAIAGPRGLTASDLYHITGHRGAVVPILEGYPAFCPTPPGAGTSQSRLLYQPVEPPQEQNDRARLVVLLAGLHKSREICVVEADDVAVVSVRDIPAAGREEVLVSDGPADQEAEVAAPRAEPASELVEFGVGRSSA